MWKNFAYNECIRWTNNKKRHEEARHNDAKAQIKRIILNLIKLIAQLKR